MDTSYRKEGGDEGGRREWELNSEQGVLTGRFYVSVFKQFFCMLALAQ